VKGLASDPVKGLAFDPLELHAARPIELTSPAINTTANPCRAHRFEQMGCVSIIVTSPTTHLLSTLASRLKTEPKVLSIQGRSIQLAR
jgi:hypothetical protein